MEKHLFDQITDATVNAINSTGLSAELITNELNKIIESAGLKKEQMTLEDLRRVLSEYVQDVLVAAKEDLSQNKNVGQQTSQKSGDQ